MKIDFDLLSPAEKSYLTKVLKNGFPGLNRRWSLMDEAWIECGCDPEVMDERIKKFYSHPVWLLSGLSIEQDAESLKNRRVFSTYIAGLKPNRVADFGGGFGKLARMIGECCPCAEVHIVEPHPHTLAMSMAERTKNVRFVRDFIGEYDVLVATDVFEHVPDPLSLVEKTAAHLRAGGQFIIANCFWPVILCHLPSTFHFRWSWDKAMLTMNLIPGESVSYGRAYKKIGPVSATRARKIELRSKRLFPVIKRLPKIFHYRLARLIF